LILTHFNIYLKKLKECIDDQANISCFSPVSVRLDILIRYSFVYFIEIGTSSNLKGDSFYN